MIESRYTRNGGFITEAEQKKLGQAVVSVAGAGGDGGALAIAMAQLGIGADGGEIRLADPDPFEIENINRQACCNEDTVGRNKAEVVGEYIRRINPNIRVRIFNHGVQQESLDEFLDGSDLLVDETEFTTHAVGTMLARGARARSIPNLQAINIGFGAQITSYRPQGRHTFERRLGIPEDMPLDEVASLQVDIQRWFAGLPVEYIDLAAFKKVASGEKSTPSVSPGVLIAAGAGATQVMLHIIGGQNNRRSPIYFPQTLTIDALTGAGRVVRYPRLRTHVDLSKVLLRNKLGLNPHTEYGNVA